MDEYYIDAAYFTDDKEETQKYLAERLDFPDYYGRNLDALFDCLTELPETEIYIDHEDEASAYGRLVINVFLEAVEENPNLTVYLISDEGGDEDVLTPEEEAEIINSLFDDEE